MRNSKLAKAAFTSVFFFMASFVIEGIELTPNSWAQAVPAIISDSNTQYTPDGGTTWVNTFQLAGLGMTPDPNYNTIPNTYWINWSPNRFSGPFNDTSHYKTTFELPQGFTNTSLTVQIFADNVATVYLNGTQIGQQPFAAIGANFGENGQNPSSGPPSKFSTSDQSLFVNGTNIIAFDIYNFGGPTGFDYKATITSGCPGPVPNVPILGQADPLWNPPDYRVNYSNLYGLSDTFDFRNYDSYPSNDSVNSIRKWGCALTSLSIALLNEGLQQIQWLPPLTANPTMVPLDPGSLNLFMEATPGDYTSGGGVRFEPTTRTASGGKLKWFNVTTFDSLTSPDDAAKVLDFILCHERHPAIVGVKLNFSNPDDTGIPTPKHYVVVIGKQDDGKYLIINPATGGIDTLDTYNYTVTVVGTPPNQTVITNTTYSNPVYLVRGWVADPPGDISELDLAVEDNADLLLIDNTGKRTGVTSGNLLLEIPGASYHRDSLVDDITNTASAGTTHSIQVTKPPSGIYNVTVTGIHNGTYTLSANMFSQDGSSQPAVLIPGIAGIGTTSSLQIQFNPAPGSVSKVIRVASFAGTSSDISNSLNLGLIDNKGIAHSLASKIQEASAAASRGDSKTSVNILNAFKNELTAQTGKHITGIAPQVLLEDANSLISQNS